MERKRRLGQIFTPRDIADWMVRAALQAGPLRWLDPSLGGGVFVDALQQALTKSKDIEAPVVRAFEIDDQIDLKPRLQWPQVKLRLSRQDFLTARVRSRFDACVANPPYIRHHALRYSDDVWHQFDDQVGAHLSRKTNLYCLFMLRIWSLLAANGRAIIITPLEWLNADFGCAVKAYLLKQNALDSLILFDDATTVFGDALTTAGITILRRNRCADEPIRTTTLKHAADLARLPNARFTDFAATDLNPKDKWTARLRRQPRLRVRKTSVTVPLADKFSCSRGIATGANDYFTFSEEKRRENRIDARDLSPCITRASDLRAGNFERDDWRTLVVEGKRAWLLTPRKKCNPALRAYLDFGIESGIDRRHLPRHRPVWFRPEKRAPAPILISVFFRERPRVVLNKARVLNLTAYHGIYPLAAAASDHHLKRLVKWLNSDAATAALLTQARVYGGGLRKLEPRDVMAVRIPVDLAD